MTANMWSIKIYNILILNIVLYSKHWWHHGGGLKNHTINTNQDRRILHSTLHIIILSKIPGCKQFVNIKADVIKEEN